jgi:hypothetical protein
VPATAAPAAHEPLPRILLLVAIAVLVGIGIGVAVDRRHGSSSTATLNGSGVAASQTRTVAPFHALALSGIGAVSIRVGRPQSVAVRADDNLLSRIRTNVSGGTLQVDERGSIRPKQTIRLAIDVPTLDGLALSGTGSLAATGLRAETLNVEVSGTGSVTASGRATTLSVDVSGAGQALLGQLASRDATVRVTGVGAVQLDVSHSLDASIEGAGSVVYSGHPAQVTKSVSGAGSIAGR